MSAVARQSNVASVNQKFKTLEGFTGRCQRGEITGILVTGSSGVGKTHAVMSTLERLSDYILPEEFLSNDEKGAVIDTYELSTSDGSALLDMSLTNVIEMTKKTDRSKFTLLKGHCTGTSMALALYCCRNKGDVLVIDDVDRVLTDKMSQQILLAATDSTTKRMVSFAPRSIPKLVPQQFQFMGAVIILSNASEIGKRSPALAALVDRMFHLDFTLTAEERRERLRHVALNEGMLRKIGLDGNEVNEVWSFYLQHEPWWREPSLRTLDKLGRLRLGGGDWRRDALASLVA